MTILSATFYKEATGLAIDLHDTVERDGDIPKYDLLRLMILSCAISEPEARTVAYLMVGAPENLDISDATNWAGLPEHADFTTAYHLTCFSAPLLLLKRIQALSPENLAINSSTYADLVETFSANLKKSIHDAVHFETAVLRSHNPTMSSTPSHFQSKLLELSMA